MESPQKTKPHWNRIVKCSLNFLLIVSLYLQYQLLLALSAVVNCFPSWYWPSIHSRVFHDTLVTWNHQDSPIGSIHSVCYEMCSFSGIGVFAYPPLEGACSFSGIGVFAYPPLEGAMDLCNTRILPKPTVNAFLWGH